MTAVGFGANRRVADAMDALREAITQVQKHSAFDT